MPGPGRPFKAGEPPPPGAGRPKGRANNRTITLIEKVKEAVAKSTDGKVKDYDPVVAMAEMANDPAMDDLTRANCHRNVSRYIHAERKAIELTGEEGGPVELRIAAVDSIVALLDKIISEKK